MTRAPPDVISEGGDRLGMDVQGGDVAVRAELEMECQPDGAARKVTGYVDVRVMPGVSGDNVMDGVDDPRDFTAPGSDGVEPVPLDAFVLDDGGLAELGEVGLHVGLGRKLEITVDECRAVS